MHVGSLDVAVQVVHTIIYTTRCSGGQIEIVGPTRRRTGMLCDVHVHVLAAECICMYVCSRRGRLVFCSGRLYGISYTVTCQEHRDRQARKYVFNLQLPKRKSFVH